MINGLVYDFESIKLNLPTGLVVMAESVSYNDKKDDEVINGISNIPVGLGRGEYSGECEIEFGRSEYEKLNSQLAADGGFYNNPYVDIVVSYGWSGQPIITDNLAVHFTERDFSGKKGDTSLNVKIKGAMVMPLLSNGNPAYTPF
jgi:hypothetical protein